MKLTKEVLATIENFMLTKYHFRYNTIKEKVELKEIETDYWRTLSKFDINCLKRDILIELELNINYTDIERLIESTFCIISNPIKDYFLNLEQWDKKDYIKELAQTIKIKSSQDINENLLFEKYLKKWLASVVANVFDDNFCRNHTCLVLTGMQGTYKTTWLENLCPKELKSTYLYSGKIDPNSKDVNSIIAEYLFCNIDDQLNQLNRKDENDIKELITKNKVSYRRPYDKYIKDYPHICSFMASVNGNDFLTDSTGNRRFLPFEVEKIDIDKAINLFEKKEKQIYAQSIYYYKKGIEFNNENLSYFISSEDIEFLNSRNKKFEFISFEEDMLQKYFNVPNEDLPENMFMSTGEIVNWIYERGRGEKMNLYRTGKALTKLGYTKTQRLVNGNRITGWKLHIIYSENENNYNFTPQNFYEVDKF